MMKDNSFNSHRKGRFGYQDRAVETEIFTYGGRQGFKYIGGVHYIRGI